MKTILLTLYLMIPLPLLAAADVATDTGGNASTQDLAPPFGIRHFNAGAAPDFTLQDIDGEKFELNSTRGHWVFLHFWASWCGPCKKEMPGIQRLADEMQGDKFQVVMINTAEDEDTIFEFLATIGVDLNTLMDIDGKVTEIYKPRGLPTTFLLNPKGEIKYQAIGGREWDAKIYVDFLKKL